MKRKVTYRVEWFGRWGSPTAPLEWNRAIGKLSRIGHARSYQKTRIEPGIKSRIVKTTVIEKVVT